MTWWNFPSVLGLGWCQLLVFQWLDSLKEGSEFPELFLRVTAHSFGIHRRSAECLQFKLEVRWSIWASDSFQSMTAKPCFQPCPARCNFTFVNIAFSHIKCSWLKKNNPLVWLIFIFHKYCVIRASSQGFWQCRAADYLNLCGLIIIWKSKPHSSICCLGCDGKHMLSFLFVADCCSSVFQTQSCALWWFHSCPRATLRLWCKYSNTAAVTGLDAHALRLLNP